MTSTTRVTWVGRALASMRSVRAATLLLALAAPVAARAQAVPAGAAVLTGTVRSEAGQPLAAANVFIPEMQISVATSPQGIYTITVPAERVRGQATFLRVRAIGFAPSSKPVTITAGRQEVNFELRQDVNRLTDIVVTGVSGATERQKVPFSVARVDSSSMPVVAVNPISQLQGKVPGATIVPASGRPGAQPSVLLRGPTSINGAGRNQGPLYIVDGVILNGPLPDFNGQDVESVEVLKGASAATLYGSRAAGGVIQIKTKSGSGARQGVQFALRSEYGANDIERDFGLARNHGLLMSGDRTRFCAIDTYTSNNACTRSFSYVEELARINNAIGDFPPATNALPIDPGSTLSGDVLRRAFISGNFPGTRYNAVDQVVDPQPMTLNDFSITGRNGGTNFFASVNHTQQGGAIRFLQGFSRSSGRVNVQQTMGTAWNLGLNTFFSRSRQDGFNLEDGGAGFFRLTRSPSAANTMQRDTLGRLYIRTNLQSGGSQNENPLYSFENNQRFDDRNRVTLGGNVRYTPLEWFDAEATMGYDRGDLSFRQFQNKGFRTPVATPATNNGFLFNGTANSAAYNTNVQATVRRELFSDLRARFNVRTFYEQQDQDFRNLQGQTLNVADVDAAPNATAQIYVQSGRQSVRQLSYSAAANFDFKDRYILDGVVRRDGNSVFGNESRWANYGRVSGSWLVAREAWFPSDKISQFTLRASSGSAGNIPPFFAQYETFTVVQGGALNPSTLGNRSLRPEVMRETEIGTDMEFFNRVGLTVNYARANVQDQILPVPLPAAKGFERQWQNAGTLRNNTIEVSLTTPFIQRKDLSWSGRWNYSGTRSTVTKLNAPPFFLGAGLQQTANLIWVEEGRRFGEMRGRKFIRECGDLPSRYQGSCGGATSAFQKNSDGYVVWVGEGNNPGMGITDNLWATHTIMDWGTQTSGAANVRAVFGHPLVLRDSTGSGRVVPLGNALPDYQLGFSQNLNFKRLSLYGLLDGNFGASIWNQARHWAHLDLMAGEIDQSGKSVQDAKPIGYYYRAGPGPDNAAGIGGFYDLLGVNSHFVEKSSFMKLREVSASYHLGPVLNTGDFTVSFIGRNLKTWTKYKGFDPEVGVSTVPVTPGTPGATNFNIQQTGTAALNPVDAFTFPNLRTFSLVIGTRF